MKVVNQRKYKIYQDSSTKLGVFVTFVIFARYTTSRNLSLNGAGLKKITISTEIARGLTSINKCFYGQVMIG